MKSRYYGIGFAMVAVALAAILYFMPELSGEVPVVWGKYGAMPAAHDSVGMMLLLGPGSMVAMMAIFAAIPWLSPRHFEVDGFMRTYLKLMLICVAMMGYMFAITLWTDLHGPWGTDRFIAGGTCVLAVLLGNFMGKVQRNFFVGIRTPWTLASGKVWHATHRLGGRLMVAGGIVGLLPLLAGAPSWISSAIVIASFLAPALYSLVLYKSLERKGELDGTA